MNIIELFLGLAGFAALSVSIATIWWSRARSVGNYDEVMGQRCRVTRGDRTRFDPDARRHSSELSVSQGMALLGGALTVYSYARTVVDTVTQVGNDAIAIAVLVVLFLAVPALIVLMVPWIIRKAVNSSFSPFVGGRRRV
jgi:hypothetical protein